LSKDSGGDLLDLCERMAETLRAVESRDAVRTGPEELAVFVAVRAEMGLLVRDLAATSPETVSAADIDAAIDALREAQTMVERLFLQLGWLWTRGGARGLRVVRAPFAPAALGASFAASASLARHRHDTGHRKESTGFNRDGRRSAPRLPRR
jgi:hypothetical protein